jgi:hypothetical protein
VGAGAQAFDKHMQASWTAHCRAAGKHDWERRFPDAGSYNTEPASSPFFRGDYKSEYGRCADGWWRPCGLLGIARASVAGAAVARRGGDAMHLSLSLL